MRAAGSTTSQFTFWRVEHRQERQQALKGKEKDGSSVDLSCAEFVVDYNKFMNGVDAHDPLRLQR